MISSKLAEKPIQEEAEPSRPANNEKQDFLFLTLNKTFAKMAVLDCEPAVSLVCFYNIMPVKSLINLHLTVLATWASEFQKSS